VVLAGSSLLAQDTPPAAQSTPPAASPEPGSSGSSPVPSGDQILSGYIDLGYRWVTGVGGSVNTYRSIVDLGSGPKMLGTDFTIINLGKPVFDRIDVRATDWGDDPYSTAQVDIRKNNIYNFSGSYRNMAYYSNLPAFADPLRITPGSGLALNEQAMDTRKKIGTYRLEILPWRRIVPYLEYEHNSENGTGVNTFVANANEYPVPNRIRNSTENYRGGVRVELSRFHAKLEQGGTTFKDDQELNQSGGTPNFGNFLSPILGQTLYLNSLTEGYHVTGHSIYTDASFGATLASWADVYGTFLYSQPVSDVQFAVHDTGNQVLFSQVLFYTAEQNLLSAFSKQPHTTGSLGAEIRPLARLRVIPSWFTDRMHTTGASNGVKTLTAASGLVPISTLTNSRLVNNSSQAEMSLIFEVTRKITLRGGYRYVWGNATDLTLPLAGLAGFEQGKIRRNVALAGFSWHPVQNAWINIDFENGSSGSTYFRTGLYNYQKARIRGQHQITPSFSVSASASVLNNQNPSPGVHYDFLAHQESVSLNWHPSKGKTWDFEAGYTRSTLRSDIFYLDPAYLTPSRSFYRDNSHTVTGLFNVNLPGRLANRTKLAVGGSAVLSSGSNPTTFYQPTARLAVTLHRNIAWLSEWRYYGFAESFYAYQGFRSDMVTTGVRISR
jgi:hypothetical protein